MSERDDVKNDDSAELNAASNSEKPASDKMEKPAEYQEVSEDNGADKHESAAESEIDKIQKMENFCNEEICKGTEITGIYERTGICMNHPAFCMNNCYGRVCIERPKPCRERRTYLKCSKPQTLSLPTETLVGTAYTVAVVDLDTSGFCNPCIYFDFTSNIVTTAAVLDINFQIFKQCGRQAVPIAVSPIWRYSAILPLTASDSFTFGSCRCDVCSEKCCSYYVRITVMGVATVGITSINNMTLSAFVAEKVCDD